MPEQRRPRSSRYAWSPAMLASSRPADAVLDREVEAIAALLREEGPLRRSAIRDRLETRYWGPGRLGLALAEARRRGRIVRVARRTYHAVR